MLICFGLSWPISLIKNIKAHSAKNMSLKFNMLIILGYIAGITAKFMNGAFNYVLIVYLLNLLIVCANVVIYFINKSYDIAKNQKPFPAFQGSAIRSLLVQLLHPSAIPLATAPQPFQSGLSSGLPQAKRPSFAPLRRGETGRGEPESHGKIYPLRINQIQNCGLRTPSWFLPLSEVIIIFVKKIENKQNLKKRRIKTPFEKNKKKKR